MYQGIKKNLNRYKAGEERRPKMVRFDVNYIERRKSFRIFPDAVNGIINTILTIIVLGTTLMFYVSACNKHDVVNLIAGLFH